MSTDRVEAQLLSVWPRAFARARIHRTKEESVRHPLIINDRDRSEFATVLLEVYLQLHLTQEWHKPLHNSIPLPFRNALEGN